MPRASGAGRSDENDPEQTSKDLSAVVPQHNRARLLAFIGVGFGPSYGTKCEIARAVIDNILALSASE
jgi:hypothetical protein